MIKLQKLPEPEILRKNKEAWTEAYNNYTNQSLAVPDSLKYKYRDPEIKQCILEETHEKCAYCESKVTPVYAGDVEHILPKSKRPELIFEWDNLTLACQQCNQRKRDYYEPDTPLVNPYKDEPTSHFFFAGPMLFHKPGSARGYMTKMKLELNRLPLFERRKERLENVNRLVEIVAKEQNETVKEALRSELDNEAQGDKEYTLMVQTFLNVVS